MKQAVNTQSATFLSLGLSLSLYFILVFLKILFHAEPIKEVRRSFKDQSSEVLLPGALQCL